MSLAKGARTVALQLVVMACTGSAGNDAARAGPERSGGAGQSREPTTQDGAAAGKELLAALDGFDYAHFVPFAFADLLQALRDDQSVPQAVKVEHLLQIADRHPTARELALWRLTSWRAPQLGKWLAKNEGKLRAEDWQGVVGALESQHEKRITWQDPAVLTAMSKQALGSADDAIRLQTTRGLACAGRQEDILAMLDRLQVEKDPGILLAIYEGLPRFNHPKVNQELRTLFKRYQWPSTIALLLRFEMLRSNRHDFLPDISRLRSRVSAIGASAGKDESSEDRRKHAEEVREAIDEAIPALEKARAAGVPVGERLQHE